ncbi:MAG: YitT family protein [Oscillospiraceae bacterium]|jgi:uncharacterized membrane-anchored protein YitT (DUF2179 family)|nr:YitT family protein [Oscillospiraceae bacterium]
MKSKHPALRLLRDYGVITLGCAIYAVSFQWFFQPNNIAMGGFTGVGQIFNRLLPFLPVGTIVILMNVPLFILGVRRQGLKILISSLFATVVSNLMIDGLDAVYTFQPMDEPLLACVYGGVTVGAAMALMLTVGATTGGTELAARLLKYRIRHLSIGRLCLIIDVAVVSLYSLVFRQVNTALYGIIGMYISSLAMDAVVYGSVGAKMAYIISAESAEITRRILDLELGVTLLQGKGGYHGDDKQVILCAFKPSQIGTIKALVTEVDPNAFIIVCEAHEIVGEGFGEYTPDSL